VVYTHDGQNLFDPKTSFAGVDWGISDAMCRLLAEGAIRKTLVVGIWNTSERYREYDPQKVFEKYLNPQEKTAYAREHGWPMADPYLKFIVQELKPFIDCHYRTLPTMADTFLMGSSMGGMVSAYALCEYPEVFGGAACLSTHWPAVQGKMADYLAARLPASQNHRFYFDYGTETVDAQYEPFQRVVDDLLRRKGYVEGNDWVTRKFCGEDHSEQAWRRRVDIPLRFLLKR
jgi:enterochelin esterase-like enzyme